MTVHMPEMPGIPHGGTPHFYARDGERFAPTPWVISPWNGRTQSGVAVAALVGHVVGSVPSLTPMSLARLTIDILGAIPMAPLEAHVELLRDGKRFQTIAVTLAAEGRAQVRATAVKVRMAESPPHEHPPTWAPPSAAEAQAARSTLPWLQTIPRKSDFTQIGPGAQWMRVSCEAVAGEALSPLERLAIASDFGSGVGLLLPTSDWTLANIDISLSATRLPEGEWLLIDSFAESAGSGFGVANARIGDARGMFATAHQTIFLDPR